HFIKIAQQFEPDIVHLQFPTQGYDYVNGLTAIAWNTRKRFRLPFVTTLHEFLPRSLGRFESHVHALALLSSMIVVVRPAFRVRMPWYMRALIRGDTMKLLPNASIVPQARPTDAERDALRQKLGTGARKLVAFFGFSYPHKGVELLFRIANPARHHLLLIGHLAERDAYHRELRALVQ